jgi:hypothetical protein
MRTGPVAIDLPLRTTHCSGPISVSLCNLRVLGVFVVGIAKKDSPPKHRERRAHTEMVQTKHYSSASWKFARYSMIRFAKSSD